MAREGKGKVSSSIFILSEMRDQRDHQQKTISCLTKKLVNITSRRSHQFEEELCLNQDFLLKETPGLSRVMASGDDINDLVTPR